MGKGWGNCVGPECFSTRTQLDSIGSLLSPHHVSELEPKATQGGDLFGSQFAANSHLQMNSHSRLGCLGRGEIVYALFDEVVVNWLGVQCLIQGDISFTDSSIRHLALGLRFFDNHPNSLPLLRRETKLCNWVLHCNRRRRRILHGKGRSREEHYCKQGDE